MEHIRTLPNSRPDGRPRFLSPTPLGGAVVVLLFDSETAYVHTVDADDWADFDALGLPRKVEPLRANGVDYPHAWGHFRAATDGSGDWAVDLDGDRPRLDVRRGGVLGSDATDSGRRKVGEALAQVVREVAHEYPEALTQAARAAVLADLGRADEELTEAVRTFGDARAQVAHEYPEALTQAVLADLGRADEELTEAVRTFGDARAQVVREVARTLARVVDRLAEVVRARRAVVDPPIYPDGGLAAVVERLADALEPFDDVVEQ